MTATMTEEVLQDGMAVSVARILAAANRHARALGVNVPQSIVTIRQDSADGESFWSVNYGPNNYLECRGGDLLIEVNSSDGGIRRVLRGQ
jgi:hypothetical protein